MKSQVVGLWAWTLAVVAVGAFLLAGPRHSVDFPSYYFGAKALLAGQDPYGSIGQGYSAGPVYPFLYPPMFVSWLRWIGAMPYDAAEVVWWVLLSAALVGMVYALARKMGNGPVLIACGVFTVSALHNFFNGQANILVAACLAGAVITEASVWIMAAAALKATPILILPWFRFNRYWLTAFGLVSLISTIGLWVPFLRATQKYTYGATFYPTLNAAMYSNLGFTAWPARTFGVDTSAAKWGAVLLVAVVTVVLALLGKRWWRKMYAPLVLSLWFVLLSPVVWDHHMVMLIPSLAYALWKGARSWLPVTLFIACEPWNQIILKLPESVQPIAGLIPGTLLLFVLFRCASSR